VPVCIVEEIVRLENELKNLIQEAGAKVNSEVNEVKTMYKDKLRDANVQIEVLIEVKNRRPCNNRNNNNNNNNIA